MMLIAAKMTVISLIVLLLILLVCVIQIIFDLAARKADKRTR